MKHIRLIVILSLVVLVFLSCGDMADTAENKSSTRFIYRMANGEALDWNVSAGMPIKINLITGKTTPVCIDPLCMHDNEDCPFFECYGCAIDGEVLFFRRGLLTRNDIGYDGKEKLCTYNATDGKVQILDEYSGSIVYAGIHRDVLYYYIAEWSDKKDELSCVYKLFRADGKNGKIRQLKQPEEYHSSGGYISNDDYPNILSITDDVIYWLEYSDEMTMSYYTTDLNNENRQDIEINIDSTGQIFHDGWGYSIVGVSELLDKEAGRTPENMKNSYTLNRVSLSDHVKETVAENLGTPNIIITDKYIFTLDSDNKTYQNSQYGGLSEILTGCSIWRMNHDGSDRIFVAETDDYLFSYNQFTSDDILIDYYEDDENTYLALAITEYNENNKPVHSVDTLILNTATGEFVLSGNKDKK